ncbi:MAG: DUF507 family protein [Epsilonproteobacteria bacterium]|nr:DUF507 domain-containing protein [Campylobacterota bacterium]NPA57138.1 DUF507 family protein [Campylobacterota bacterium]
MRLRLPHAPYVAHKIAIDLLKSGLVTFTSGVEPVIKAVREVLEEELKREAALDERVKELMEEHEEEIEFTLADSKQLFIMIKRRLAPEYGVILNYEDKYNDYAHKILKRLYEDDLIYYEIPDNKVKNIIYGAIMGYVKSYDEIEDIVLEKMSHYKRKLVPGSEEYNIVFDKIFEAELRKRGMLI